MNPLLRGPGRDQTNARVRGMLPEAARAMQVQQGLVLALAHCLSISSNADLQQQMVDEVLKDLAPACHHLQSLHQSKGAALPASLTYLTSQVHLHGTSRALTQVEAEH